jgi:hypothetical protein
VTFRMVADTVRYMQRFANALNPTYEFKPCSHPPQHAPAVSASGAFVVTPKVTPSAASTTRDGPPPTLKSVATALVVARRIQKGAAAGNKATEAPPVFHSHGHRSDLIFRPLPETDSSYGHSAAPPVAAC